MNTKNVILATAIAAVLLIAAVGSASAVTVINNCVFNANVDGEYYVLGDNLDCSGQNFGITISADNITIDGYNSTDDVYYAISNAIYYGIYNDYTTTGLKNVTIKNLEIYNCSVSSTAGIHFTGNPGMGQEAHYEDNTIFNCTIHDNSGCGIWIRGSPNKIYSENFTIDTCRIYNNGENITHTEATHGISLDQTISNSTVKNCYIFNNTGGNDVTPVCECGGNGIWLKGSGGALYNKIINNYLYDNREGGFLCKAGPRHTNLTGNTLWGNEQGGIILRCKSTRDSIVKYNNASYNYGTGIFIGGHHNDVSNNIASCNMNGAKTGLPVSGTHGTGINLGRNDAAPLGSRNNHVTNNTACGHVWKDYCEHADVVGTNTRCNNTGDTCLYFNDDYSDGGCSVPHTGGCCANPCPTPLTFEKNLVECWNLVSLPLTPSDKKVSSVFASIDGNYDKVMRYDAATHTFVELSTDSEMKNSVGYFIHINKTGTFAWNYSGAAYENINVGLSQGLNCIGWTNTSVSLPDALSSIVGKYNYVARWNATLHGYEVYEPNAPAPFNDFDMMERGVGYFITAKETCTLVYP